MAKSKASQRRDQNERAARVAEMRRKAESQERRRRLVLQGVIAVVVLAIVGGIVGIALATHKSKGDASGIKGVQSYANLSRDHTTTPVTYPQTPPVGGAHDPTWLNCGIYDKPVRNENAVHDLEHGAVWITYRPDLPADQVTVLRDDARAAKYKGYVTLSPYPGLPAPVVLSAWGKQLKVQSASDERVLAFLSYYADSPSAPEAGGECTGGTGTPIK